MEDDPKLSRFYTGFYIQGDRSTTNAERAADCKLARLRRQTARIALQRYWECEPRSILVRRDLSALAIFFLVYPALSNSVRGEQSAHEVSVYSEEQALRGRGLYAEHCASCHDIGRIGRNFRSKITLPASSTTHTDVAFTDRLRQHETATVMRLAALTGGSCSDAEKEHTGRTRGSDCRRPATNTTRDNAMTLQLSRRQGAKLLARGAVALAAPFSYFSILGTKEVLAEEFAADRKTIEQWMDQWMIVTKQVSGSLHVQRFADPIYILTKPITWKPNPGQERLAAVTVPVGFVTDFASIPRLFWSKTGR